MDNWLILVHLVSSRYNRNGGLFDPYKYVIITLDVLQWTVCMSVCRLMYVI